MRLFVALPVPEDVKACMAAAQTELGGAISAPLRWVRPEAIHLTLKFLGEVDLDDSTAVREALGSVACPEFGIAARGLGTFPPRGRAKTLWVGIQDPSRGLEQLQAMIEESLDPAGFPPETKGYRPHLTLARSKDRRGVQLPTTLIEDWSNRNFGQLEARRFQLVQSHLGHGPPRYEPVAEWKLKDCRG